MTFEAGGVDRELGEASATISIFADRLERAAPASGSAVMSEKSKPSVRLINLMAPDFEA